MISRSPRPSVPSPSDEHHELETLRVLQHLPREVLDRFEPRRPPRHIARYIQRAPRQQLQWLLVDVLHRLRVEGRRRPGRPDLPRNGTEAGHG